MSRTAREGLLLGLIGMFCIACGQAQPDSAKGWLAKAASHYQGHAFQTKFEMEFSLEENQQWVQVEHHGTLDHLDENYSKLDATTVMVLLTLGKRRTEIHNLQIADGEWLWMQSSLDGLPQPIVLKRPLADGDALARVDNIEGNQLSPRDLNPMVMWDLAMTHGRFELSAEQPVSQVTLQAPVTSAFRLAAAHRDEFFRPELLQVVLDRRTGAPVHLQLLKESGEISWECTFYLWKTATLQPDDFHYSPPEGVKVLLQ